VKGKWRKVVKERKREPFKLEAKLFSPPNSFPY
jgi:hypothetical protein